MDQRKPYVSPATRPATPEEIALCEQLRAPPAPVYGECGECHAPTIEINGTPLATHEATCSAQMRHDETSLTVSR